MSVAAFTASMVSSSSRRRSSKSARTLKSGSGWGKSPSPLTASLQSFLSVCENPKADWIFDASRTIGHVHLAEAAAQAVSEIDIAHFAQILNAGGDSQSPEVQVSLREMLLPALAECGEVARVKQIAQDQSSFMTFVETTLAVLWQAPHDEAELAGMIVKLPPIQRLQAVLT